MRLSHKNYLLTYLLTYLVIGTADAIVAELLCMNSFVKFWLLSKFSFSNVSFHRLDCIMLIN